MRVYQKSINIWFILLAKINKIKNISFLLIYYLFIAMKVIILALLLVAVFGLQGVTELTDANFKEEVYAEPKLWLVMFSASWVIQNIFSADIAIILNLISSKWLLSWTNWEYQ